MYLGVHVDWATFSSSSWLMLIQHLLWLNISMIKYLRVRIHVKLWCTAWLPVWKIFSSSRDKRRWRRDVAPERRANSHSQSILLHAGQPYLFHPTRSSPPIAHSLLPMLKSRVSLHICIHPFNSHIPFTHIYTTCSPTHLLQSTHCSSLFLVLWNICRKKGLDRKSCWCNQRAAFWFIIVI